MGFRLAPPRLPRFACNWMCVYDHGACLTWTAVMRFSPPCFFVPQLGVVLLAGGVLWETGRGAWQRLGGEELRATNHKPQSVTHSCVLMHPVRKSQDFRIPSPQSSSSLAMSLFSSLGCLGKQPLHVL